MRKILIVILIFSTLTNLYSEDSLDNDFNINLWPVLTYKDNSDGGKDLSVLLLFNRKTDSFNRQKELMLLPLFYNLNKDSGNHFGSLLYFSGPSYTIIPPLLSASWTNNLNRTTTWITPLFHSTTDKNGKIDGMHIINYFYSPKVKVLAPLGWSVDTVNGKHHGIIPFYAKGPTYWTVPLGLSLSWQTYYYDRVTWITPLFHLRTTKDKEFISSHFLTWYKYSEYNNNYWGVFPLWLKGPESLIIPPLLSWSYTDDDKNKNTWITPLFHNEIDEKGKLDSFHLLNIYSLKKESGVHKGFVPFWFSGPDYWVLPPALSIGWKNKKNEQNSWITPLFHQKKSVDDELLSFHYINYYGYQTEDGWKKGFAPFWYVGPDYWISPLLLSGKWTNEKEETNLWVSPLYHKSEDSNGELLSSHLLNFYTYNEGDNKHSSLFPLYFYGTNYWTIPLLLTGEWENQNSDKTLFVTPFFHKRTDLSSNLLSYHFLNFFSKKQDRGWEYTLFPIFSKGPDSWSSPILLSGSWQTNVKKSLWITPLFHLTTYKNKEVSSFHIGPYLNFDKTDHYLLPIAWYLDSDKPINQSRFGIFPLFAKGPDYFISPLGYGYGGEDDLHYGLFPVFFKTPKALIIPPLLTASWENDREQKRSWITPLFHINKSRTGDVTSLHLLNYYSNPNFSTLFPLYYNWSVDDGRYGAILPPIIGTFNGNNLNDSLLFHAQPIIYQSAGEEFEFNFLWLLFHIKKDKVGTEVTLGPLWNSKKPHNKEPMEYQVLGGLFARDVNYIIKKFKYRIFWFFGLGDWLSY